MRLLMTTTEGDEVSVDVNIGDLRRKILQGRTPAGAGGLPGKGGSRSSAQAPSCQPQAPRTQSGPARFGQPGPSSACGDSESGDSESGEDEGEKRNHKRGIVDLDNIDTLLRSPFLPLTPSLKYCG